ncbi:TPA: amino acid ABC transporter substrate-binding protein [Thermoplasmata archaeon]|nr:amino acid ABC transporter substrate-binding protein [Thermoplasmata archaeon]
MARTTSSARGIDQRPPEGTRPVNDDEETGAIVALKKRSITRKTKIIGGAVVAAILIVSGAWVISGVNDREVTIVAILPLSGWSSYLVEIEDSMTLTVEKINRWGGINGMHVRLVVMDCESSPDVAVDKLREAHERYDPLAVLTATRGAATPMSAYAEENGILLISVGATAETLTEGKDWIFRYYVTPTGEAETALATLDDVGAGSVGIIHLDDVYGNPVKNQVVSGFEASGGVAESYAFSPDSTEFSEAVTSVADNDAVFVVALRHQFPYIFEELNSSGYSGHVLAAVEASIPEMWGLPAAEGALVSAPLMYYPGAAIDTEFVLEFEQRYGVPLTHQGAIGSDVLKLIWGLLSDGEVSMDNLRAQLTSDFVFSGILGVVTVEGGAHNIDVAVYPAVIEGGELQYRL